MKIPGTTLVGLLIIIILLFSSNPVCAKTVYLFGKIGDFPVGAELERDEGKLSGWYFYQSRVRRIRLEGKIDRDGLLHMEELTGSKKTGVFEGSVKKGRWTGTWRKAPGAAPLAFSFEENLNNLKDLRGDYDCEARERVARHRYTYEWNLKITVADGVVKRLDSVQGAHGDNKDDQTCSIDLKELKQVDSGAGILLEARDSGPDGQGGRCTVRIVGNDDVLWVRFGDSSEEGNDCRSAGSTMFCSPRAFWNDIILDRRTKKCKALK
jgi:hypothetical protein